MSLVRHAKSPFWYMSFMVKGKSIFRSTKTSNKGLAQKIENETRRQMVEGLHFEKQETCTLKEIIDEYVLTREGGKSYAQVKVAARKLLGIRYSSKTKKDEEVYGFDPLMPFEEMTSKDLFRLMMARKSEGISTGTFIHELLFINALIIVAKELGYRVPELDIKSFKKDHKLKQEKKPIRYLSPEEEKKLLAELDPMKSVNGLASPQNQSDEVRRIRQDTYDFVVTLLDIGARYDEISSLEWSCINLENRQIRLHRSKVENESTLMMTNRLYNVMLRRSQNKNSERYVFTNKDGGPRNYNPNGLAGAIKRAGIKNCSFHTMRKTLASKLVRGGLAISDVSVILGHASITTTAIYYASLCPVEASKRAVALLGN